MYIAWNEAVISLFIMQDIHNLLVGFNKALVLFQDKRVRSNVFLSMF